MANNHVERIISTHYSTAYTTHKCTGFNHVKRGPNGISWLWYLRKWWLNYLYRKHGRACQVLILSPHFAFGSFFFLFNLKGLWWFTLRWHECFFMPRQMWSCRKIISKLKNTGRCSIVLHTSDATWLKSFKKNSIKNYLNNKTKRSL